MFVTIDGDRYLLDIPSHNDINEVFAVASDKSSKLHDMLFQFFLHPFCSRDGKTKLYQSCLSPNPILFDEEGFLVNQNRISPTWFRPVLIPLKKDGSFDPAPGMVNPNGTQVSGGSLWFCGAPVPPDFSVKSLLTAQSVDYGLDPQKIKIGDSCKISASWFWWNGKLLYSGRPVLLNTLALWRWVEPWKKEAEICMT